MKKGRKFPSFKFILFTEIQRLTACAVKIAQNYRFAFKRAVDAKALPLHSVRDNVP